VKSSTIGKNSLLLIKVGRSCVKFLLRVFDVIMLLFYWTCEVMSLINIFLAIK